MEEFGPVDGVETQGTFTIHGVTADTVSSDEFLAPGHLENCYM